MRNISMTHPLSNCLRMLKCETHLSIGPSDLGVLFSCLDSFNASDNKVEDVEEDELPGVLLLPRQPVSQPPSWAQAPVTFTPASLR